ncbi:MAG: hypothetical protein UMR38_00815 [Candidatus Izemoplasma sp.]|nr:hypothetical protein [Candidatus Izemoplasma sp.]
MVKNDKGFSLVELLAIIVITTTIIVPLLSSLVDNIEINYRMHNRRSATSVAQGTLYGIGKLTFSDLESLVNDANTNADYFIELNETNCTLLPTQTDEDFCNQIFAQIWNNLSFDDTTYRAFIYDYNLPQAYIDDLTSPSNTDIPPEVKTEIEEITASTDPNPSLLRVTVWIQYEDDPRGVIILSGLITND